VDYVEEFRATKDIITTYQTTTATDSVAHACMRDLKMQLKAKHALRMKKGPSAEKLSPVPNRNTEWLRTHSTYSKSTIQSYTNVPASTPSKFTSWCIMRNQCSALDTESKTAPKRWKRTIQRCVWTLIAGQIVTFGTNSRLSTTTCASMSSRCCAFTSISCLRKATEPSK